MNKNYIVWLVTGVALVLSVFAVVNSGSPGSPGKDGRNGLGAIPGNSIEANEFCVGGVCTLSYGVGMTNATSTQCVIRVTATSTLERFRATITTGTTTNALAILSTSTTPFAKPLGQATSSLIASAIILGTDNGGTNGAGFLVVPAYISSSVAQGSSLVNATSTAVTNIIRGGEYLIFSSKGGGVSNDTQTGTVWTGKCTAQLLAY